MPFNNDVQRFIPRELSWLSFNRRVLQEAENPDTPLMERLRFLGIFSNNLDEFFRVRVGTIKRVLQVKDVKEAYGSTPKEVLEKINHTSLKYERLFYKTYQNIVAELRQHGLCVVNEAEISEKQIKYVKSYFRENFLNALSPIMLNQVHQFPSLADKFIYMMVELSNQGSAEKEYSLIEVPTVEFSRFVKLPDEDGRKYLMLIDDVIRCCLADIFTILPYDTFRAYAMKITRDADIDIDNDISHGLIEKIAKGVKNRRKGEPVRFVYDETMPKEMVQYLVKKLNLGRQDALIPGGRYHNFKDLMGFPNPLGKEYEAPKSTPIKLPKLEKAPCIFGEIAKGDILLYYPYHSFSYYIRLLREAAIDPAVSSIKITLYRVATESKVVRALINAARNGKSVTAVVELRARFDERANMYWAEKMEEAGVKVVYGAPGLKVHAKMTHFVRVEKGREVKYSIMSTGNFHEGNANVYTDLSLMTKDKRITEDIENAFNFIEQPYQGYRFKSLLFSPLTMRKELIFMIDREIRNAKAGKHACIMIKVNNLVDNQIIEKLYEASSAGVAVKLMVRGMCSIIPGVKGMSENIHGISIVDRFLEHSRIFVFCNSGRPRYYMSSADLMRRNLDHRVEVAVPVYDKKVQETLQVIMDFAFKDNVKARILDKNQSNRFVRNKQKPFRSQQELKDWLSNIK